MLTTATMKRRPTPPGEMLLEEFLRPAGITQVELAARMGVPIQRVNAVIAGRRAVTAETAILLSRVLGTTPALWLNLQIAVDLWDADDFDPWETLQWNTVRFVRYRQTKPDGSVVQADWLTNLTSRQANTLAVYRMAKSRWEIENEGFNDCKSRQGFEHICHHHTNSLLIGWLLTLLALVLMRLYRLRYLHRGIHPVRSAINLVRSFWLSIRQKPVIDSG